MALKVRRVSSRPSYYPAAAGMGWGLASVNHAPQVPPPCLHGCPEAPCLSLSLSLSFLRPNTRDSDYWEPQLASQDAILIAYFFIFC